MSNLTAALYVWAVTGGSLIFSWHHTLGSFSLQTQKHLNQPQSRKIHVLWSESGLLHWSTIRGTCTLSISALMIQMNLWSSHFSRWKCEAVIINQSLSLLVLCVYFPDISTRTSANTFTVKHLSTSSTTVHVCTVCVLVRCCYYLFTVNEAYFYSSSSSSSQPININKYKYLHVEEEVISVLLSIYFLSALSK